MPIIATYINQDFNEYDTFDKIPDFNLVSKIICNNNNEIELSLQIAQFIDRIKNKKNKKREKEKKEEKLNC